MASETVFIDEDVGRDDDAQPPRPTKLFFTL
jgi:hypothetical protein